MSSVDSENEAQNNLAATRLSARLLIWPRRRRRPREDTGFVLGWRTLEEISPGRQREIILCAGILPPTLSLHLYRQRLAKLRKHIGTVQPPLCTCLTDSLEILAIWTASPSTKISQDLRAEDLSIITQQKRGYPWWRRDKAEGEEAPKYQQVVFFDPLQSETNAIFTHYYSQYGHGPPENSWSVILRRLNHAQELFGAMQTGKLPKATSNSSTSRSGGTKTNAKTSQSGYLVSLTSMAVENSATLLHFQQIYNKQAGGLRPVSWLSALSLARCMLLLPKAPLDHDSNREECALCGGQSLFRSRPGGAKTFVKAWDRYLEATLDFSFGIGLALVLFTIWRYSSADSSVWSYYGAIRRSSMNLLTRQVSNLENFPAGFKLNESLTEKMGDGIRNIFQIHQKWLEATTWNIEFGHKFIIPLLFISSGICGYNACLVIVVDLWRLETLHLWVLMHIFRYVYNTELFLLSALFRVFRGKKRNVLRQRTDSMQYDAMQLLVGTLGFCICIFLWTTIMVYYTFFVLANWIFNLPVVVIWLLYVTGQSFPWGTLAWRMLRPGWFAENVHLEALNDIDADVRVAKLCSVPKSPLSLLVDCIKIHISSSVSWLVNGLLEVFSPRESNSAPCAVPFRKLMPNVQT